MLPQPSPIMVVCPVCFNQHPLPVGPGFSSAMCPRKKRLFTLLVAKTRAKNSHAGPRKSGVTVYQIRVVLPNHSEQLIVFRSTVGHFELRSGDSVVIGYYKNRAKVVLNPVIHQYMRTSDKDGCFIATTVYGSYEAPEVLTLRVFRDEILLPSLFGRIFVACYYQASPPLANLLDHFPTLRAPVKAALDRLVCYIRQKEGRSGR